MQSRLAIRAAKLNRALFPVQRIRGCATTSGRTAEHAVEEQDVYATDAMQDAKQEPSKDRPPKPPRETEAKLQSSGVGPRRRSDPIGQQKRRRSTAGSPWPAEEDDVDRETQERDNKEYYGRHKASPLSEIEVCDTRKPVTRATDGTAQSRSESDGWRPEQLDTAEDSLKRAAEIFRMNAMRGDPDSPHGRLLRQLRGEYW